MGKEYTIYAALAGEANEGWVWFDVPAFSSRTVVKVTTKDRSRTVYCECRRFDQNFLGDYEARSRTTTIKKRDEALVISKWYRQALGDFGTTSYTGKKVALDISRAGKPVWRDLRAACHHPNLSVRLGTRLGVLGFWFGLVALLVSVDEIFAVELGRYRFAIDVVVAAVVAVAAAFACRGVTRPS